MSCGVRRWLKAEKRTKRLLAYPHLIDIVGLQPRLDLQIVGIRDDFHDGVAGANDAADGVGGELMDHARRRRAYFDAVEQVPRGDAALDQFGFLALRLAKFLDDFGAKILIEPDDLKLGLADLRFRLGDRRYQLPAFAFDPRRLALQGREPRQRHQTLVVQLLNAGKFAGDQFELLGLGCDLGFEAGDLLAELRDLALQQVLLAVARGQPRPEQRIFRRQQLGRYSRSTDPPVRTEFEVGPVRHVRRPTARSARALHRVACSPSGDWPAPGSRRAAPADRRPPTRMPLWTLISATTPPVGC